jgi:4-hydroxybutyrate dehydrogenase / sulfolactaldehyde 3-reductase
MMRVGFIGLGVMGGPMALNILKGGHTLTVHDRSADAAARLATAGARVVATPKEVGSASEVVLTMLPEPQHVEQVTVGKDGIAAGMSMGGLVIEMSTIDPVTSQRVSQRLKDVGIAMVDSPVGKTAEHAVKGTLTLMIGGAPVDIERAMPILRCVGTDTFLCGGPGMGHAMKLANNFLSNTIMVANTEALAVGVKAGLQLEMMMEVMRTTMAFNHQLFVGMPKKALQGDDSPGFMVRLASKDVRLAVELARTYGFEALVGRAAQDSLERASRMGYAERDVAALMKIREDELGIKVRLLAAKPPP